MYMKWSEENKSILTKKITLEKNPGTIPQMIRPIKQGEIGKEYTIEELLYMLIIYSDNSVLGALLSQIPEDIYNRVFTDLGVPLPKDQNYTLSVKDYASFFRILYNASYLNNENSEKTLSILSQTAYNDGIRASIPSSVAIAHKF
jgi:beta-lactamase class A